MAFVPVRNARAEAVMLTADGDSQTIEPGGIVRVPAELAGKAPGWREPTPAEAAEPPYLPGPEAPQAKPTAAGAAVERDAAGRIVRVWDLGYGLLAQPVNWQPESGETVTHPHELPEPAPASTPKTNAKEG